MVENDQEAKHGSSMMLCTHVDAHDTVQSMHVRTPFCGHRFFSSYLHSLITIILVMYRDG